MYRKCYGQHVGFATFMDTWLFSLMRKVIQSRIVQIVWVENYEVDVSIRALRNFNKQYKLHYWVLNVVQGWFSKNNKK